MKHVRPVLCLGEGERSEPFEGDWLTQHVDRRAGVYRTPHVGEIVLYNGLVRQTLRVLPNAALVGYTDLMERETLLRSVRRAADPVPAAPSG